MSVRKCADCKFFADVFAGEGECRINQPIAAQRRPHNKTPKREFPRVDADDWCGEFKSKQKGMPPGLATR